MGAKAGSRGGQLLALAAAALTLVVVVLLALRPAREGDDLERAPAREPVALEREVDPRAMPAPPIPTRPERAPVEPAIESPPEEIAIEWSGQLGSTMIVDSEFLAQFIERSGMPELAGDATLSGVFTGWCEADRGRVVHLQLESDQVERGVRVPVEEPFRIEGLPAGVYRLAANMNDEPHWCGELSGVELPAATEVGGLVIVLGSPVELRGTVSDENGGPVAGAQVQLSNQNGELARTTVADETGGYTIAGGVAGQYRADASHPGYLSAASEPFELRAAEVRVLHLTLEPGLTLRGRVLDPGGVPLQGVDVFLRSRTQSMNLETDTEGRFALSPVRADEIRIYARTGGPAGQANSACCVVQVARGSDPPEVELTLRPSPEIEGVLVDEDGAPIAGVEVTARALDNAHVTREGTSAENGAFRINGLYDGTYELLVPGNLRAAPRTSVASGLGAPRVVVVFEPLPTQLHHD